MTQYRIHTCKVMVTRKPESQEVAVSFALPVDDMAGSEMQRKTAEALAVSKVAAYLEQPFDSFEGKMYELTATETFETEL